MSTRVTIKTIARDLGVSHMTVSRALSNHPNVQKETREAIVKRAAELGYTKSAAASAMRGDGTRIVGLLLPNIVNEFYARFANTLAVACEAGGYHLIIHLTNDDASVEKRSLGRLREVQAEAVVMVPAPGATASSARDFGSMKVIQLIRQHPVDVAAASVLVADRGAIVEAVLHLAGMGKRKIAYIGGDPALSSGRERLEAFRAGLETAGIAAEASPIRTGPPTFETGRHAAAEIADLDSADALICGGFEISNGVLSTLMDRGLGPRRPLHFIGYGDPSFYSWISGGVSTIGVPVESLARQALGFLRNWSNVTTEDATTKSFEAELVIRGKPV